MTEDDPLFAAFAGSVCQAIVANIIEMRAVVLVLEKRGLISTAEIMNAKSQAPPDYIQGIATELHTSVMKAMHEQYQTFLARQKDPVQ